MAPASLRTSVAVAQPAGPPLDRLGDAAARRDDPDGAEQVERHAAVSRDTSTVKFVPRVSVTCASAVDAAVNSSRASTRMRFEQVCRSGLQPGAGPGHRRRRSPSSPLLDGAFPSRTVVDAVGAFHP